MQFTFSFAVSVANIILLASKASFIVEAMTVACVDVDKYKSMEAVRALDKGPFASITLAGDFSVRHWSVQNDIACCCLLAMRTIAKDAVVRGCAVDAGELDPCGARACC